MQFDENKHPRDRDGKFTDKNENYSREVNKRIRWAKDSDIELPLNNDGSINDTELQRLYEDRNDMFPRFGSKEELDALLGEEFKGVKGQAAVEKLLKEKRGHVKAAFHREDIGDIDLFWGNEHVGIKHIIEERSKEKEGHVEEALSHLGTAIQNAVFNKKNNKGNFEFIYTEGKNKYFIIIAPEYHKNKLTYVVTTFKRSK